MTKVSDLMIKNIVVASPKEKVVDAARRLKATGVSSLIVTDDGQAKGIVTRSDFIERIIAEGRDPSSITLDEVMTDNVLTIEAGKSILDALRLMKKHRYSQLPAVEGGKLVGVIALSDVLSYLAKFFLVSGWRQP